LKTREVKLILATGAKRIGKSHYTFWHVLLPTVMGLLNNGVARKVLILDINDEYGINLPKTDEYAKKLCDGKPVIIKPIEPKDIRLFTAQKKIEIRRIRPYHYRDYYDAKGKLVKRANDLMNDQEFVRVVLKALREFRGGVILLEDIATAIGVAVSKPVFSEITRNAHRNNDIVAHIQSSAAVLPKLWQNADFIRFHKQLDDVEKSKHKLAGKYEMFKIAENLANRKLDNGTKHFFVYVDNLGWKLSGSFSKEDMIDAIHLYIDENSSALRNLLFMKDEKGYNMFNYAEARSEKTRQLFEKYWGNKNKN
jgi:hypothetical protein